MFHKFFVEDVDGDRHRGQTVTRSHSVIDVCLCIHCSCSTVIAHLHIVIYTSISACFIKTFLCECNADYVVANLIHTLIRNIAYTIWYDCDIKLAIIQLHTELYKTGLLVLSVHLYMTIGLIVTERYGSLLWFIIDSLLHLLHLPLWMLESVVMPTPHHAPHTTAAQDHTHREGH